MVCYLACNKVTNAVSPSGTQGHRMTNDRMLTREASPTALEAGGSYHIRRMVDEQRQSCIQRVLLLLVG